MNYNYQEVSADTERNGKRIYHTKDGDYASITTILSATADKTWLKKWQQRVGKEEAERVRIAAGTRGTKVHKHMENHLQGKEVDLSQASKEEVGMFRALKLFFENDITEIYGQEVCLWSNELKFAGRCDLVGEWQGKPAIIDFKTARKPKRKEWIKDYYLQTLAYGLAHDEMYGSDIRMGVVLITVENDLPQHFIVDFEDDAWMYEELGNRIIQYYREN
jgi:ATP-dependent exoDNAse (exonuclease V) beta subunit